MFKKCPQCMSLINASTKQLRSNQGMLSCPYCNCRFMAGTADELPEDTEDTTECMTEELTENPTDEQSSAAAFDIETATEFNSDPHFDTFTSSSIVEQAASDLFQTASTVSDKASGDEAPVDSEIVLENESALAEDETPDSLLYPAAGAPSSSVNYENTAEPALSPVELEALRANIAARTAEFETEDDYENIKLSKRPKFLHSALWGAASLILILALPIQYGYFMRDDLARYAPLRPLIKSMCQTLGCEISLQRDISQIKIIGRDVRSHPDFMNALLIFVTLNNQAPFNQAYPALELSFSDINGRPLAKRRFSPQEYLPADIDLKQGMAPNTPLRGRLEIVDPGKNAVNFQFEFF